MIRRGSLLRAPIVYERTSTRALFTRAFRIQERRKASRGDTDVARRTRSVSRRIAFHFAPALVNCVRARGRAASAGISLFI